MCQLSIDCLTAPSCQTAEFGHLNHFPVPADMLSFSSRGSQRNVTGRSLFFFFFWFQLPGLATPGRAASQAPLLQCAGLSTARQSAAPRGQHLALAPTSGGLLVPRARPFLVNCLPQPPRGWTSGQFQKVNFHPV